MKTMKLRAEAMRDVGQFLEACGPAVDHVMAVRCDTDIVVTFSTMNSLAWLRAELAKIEDGHVMADTVAAIENYTGEIEKE